MSQLLLPACFYCLLAAPSCLLLWLSCRYSWFVLLVDCYYQYFACIACLQLLLSLYYLLQEPPLTWSYCFLLQALSSSYHMLAPNTWCYRLLAGDAYLQLLIVSSNTSLLLSFAYCYLWLSTTCWNCYNLLATTTSSELTLACFYYLLPLVPLDCCYGVLVATACILLPLAWYYHSLVATVCLVLLMEAASTWLLLSLFCSYLLLAVTGC